MTEKENPPNYDNHPQHTLTFAMVDACHYLSLRFINVMCLSLTADSELNISHCAMAHGK